MSTTADFVAESPPKRGRGRPPGAYGKYRPRLPNELKAPPELNSLAQELNSAPELNVDPELIGNPPPRRGRTSRTSFLENHRWEAFARNVAKGMSAGESYLASGYNSSFSAAHSSACDLLKNPKVANRIADLKAAAAKAAMITPARVLEETGKIAFGVVAEDETDPYTLGKYTPTQLTALGHKRSALADLGKYLGMAKEKVEHSGPGGGPFQVEMLLNVLLTPANLTRLTDIEVESIRSAAAKLAAPASPAASAGPVIDGTCERVEPADEAGDS